MSLSILFLMFHLLTLYMHYICTKAWLPLCLPVFLVTFVYHFDQKAKIISSSKWWWSHRALRHSHWECENNVPTLPTNLNDRKDLTLKHVDIQVTRKLSLLLTIYKNWGDPISCSPLLLSGPKAGGGRRLVWKHLKPSYGISPISSHISCSNGLHFSWPKLCHLFRSNGLSFKGCL